MCIVRERQPWTLACCLCTSGGFLQGVCTSKSNQVCARNTARQRTGRQNCVACYDHRSDGARSFSKLLLRPSEYTQEYFELECDASGVQHRVLGGTKQRDNGESIAGCCVRSGHPYSAVPCHAVGGRHCRAEANNMAASIQVGLHN